MVGPRPTGSVPDDPAALLLECHARIRRFTAGLVAIAAQLPRTDERLVQTALDCRRYFEEALPLHAEDEDRSVRPRLPSSVALEKMSEEHGVIHSLLPGLLSDLEEISDGRAPRGYGARARALRDVLLAHIEAEERDIFPAIAGLPSPVRSEIVREMRARRGGGA